MIARGFKPVAWVAAIGSAALCCYMLSLQVASERAELASLERRIVETRQQIRALQTELGTRGRLQQLEQWNAEVLALSAPVADQYLESNLSLARFDVRQSDAAEQQVRLASAPADPPAPAPARPAIRLASVQAQPPAAAQPLLRRASLDVRPAAATAAVANRPAVTNRPAVSNRPAASTRQAAATRQPVTPARTSVASGSGAIPARATQQARTLLDESTLRDLTAESRSERDGGTRN